MNIKILCDDNLYLSLHDFFQFVCPLKKRVKELEKSVELLEKARAEIAHYKAEATTWENRYNEQIQAASRPI